MNRACPGAGRGRQVEQDGAGCLDRIAHAGDFVGRQIVHDDDVAGSQGGDQATLDIGAEDLPVMARSMTKGAVTASARRPATKVVVFQ